MKKQLCKWSVMLLALLLTVSAFTVVAFADDGETTSSLKTGEIVEIVIAGVIVVALAFFGIKYRAKVAKKFREYKSEVKRIVWYPWDQTKKGSVVVLIALVVCAAVICLLDLGLRKGILAFVKIFM